MSEVVKFPFARARGAWSRMPRRSKNNTPEERASKAAAEAGTPATVVSMPNASTAAAAPRLTYTTRELMQKLEMLNGPDRRYMEGYIQGLVDGQKCK